MTSTPHRFATVCAWVIAAVLVLAALAWLATVAFGPVNALQGAGPAATDSAAIARGAYLARVGNCVNCHTAPGGKPFAGGLPMATPIGTLYTNNITPDPETGIGHYSLADFDRAVRHGVRPDGSAEYPAMPFPSYAIITDRDLRDLYAYFMHGVAPVQQADRASTIPWPLSMRWPMTWWRWLFAPKVAAFTPAPGQSAEVARGAYLVQGLGHCGACHTARALTMQEKAMTPADGPAYLAGSDAPVDGWIAINLRGDRLDGLGASSRADLVQLLKTGHGARTAVFGNMAGVVVDSTQYLSDADLGAIAAFLKSLPPSHPPGRSPSPAGRAPPAGAALYAAHCAACHGPGGEGIAPMFPALARNPVMNSPSPISLIRVTLLGSTPVATAAGGPPGPPMPAYATQLDDQAIADIVGYIRASWGNQGSAVSAKAVAQVRKAAGAPAAAPKAAATAP